MPSHSEAQIIFMFGCVATWLCATVIMHYRSVLLPFHQPQHVLPTQVPALLKTVITQDDQVLYMEYTSLALTILEKKNSRTRGTNVKGLTSNSSVGVICTINNGFHHVEAPNRFYNRD
jgi:hypothetical protein